MKFYRNYGWILLLLFVLCDGGMPYLLGGMWSQFSQAHQVVSDLGSVTSPVKNYFEHGSILTGSLLLVSLPAIKFYFAAPIFQTMRREIFWLLLSIAAFAIGDCIFTGVFSIDHTTSGLTLATMIHGLGSGAGILGMLAAPLLLARIFKPINATFAKICGLIFLVALLSAGANGLSQLFAFSYKGIIQRVSLVFLYLPLVALDLKMQQRWPKSRN